jgi:hypothetical protein
MTMTVPAWKFEIAIEDVVLIYEKRVSVLASAVPVVDRCLLHRVGIFRMRHLEGGLAR